MAQKIEKKITKKMLMSEVIEKYPETVPILLGYGLHCVGCGYSGLDTLEKGAKLHGFSDEEITLMLNDINEIVSENLKC